MTVACNVKALAGMAEVVRSDGGLLRGVQSFAARYKAGVRVSEKKSDIDQWGVMSLLCRTFHVNMSSCVCGPAEQFAGGSLLRSFSSCDTSQHYVQSTDPLSRFA